MRRPSPRLAGNVAESRQKMRYGIYILIIVCGVLPVLLPRAWWIRTASLVVLAGLIVVYVMGLQTSARLASVEEYRETKHAPSKEWMDGAYKTRRVIEDSHPLGILLFASLVVLAAAPRREK